MVLCYLAHVCVTMAFILLLVLYITLIRFLSGVFVYGFTLACAEASFADVFRRQSATARGRSLNRAAAITVV